MACCCRRTFRKHHLAIDTFGFSFDDLLAAGETLQGTPDVTVEPSGELSASSIAIPGTDWTADRPGDAFDAGRGVTMQLSGGELETIYVVSIVCDAGNGATLARAWDLIIYDVC